MATDGIGLPEIGCAVSGTVGAPGPPPGPSESPESPTDINNLQTLIQIGWKWDQQFWQ
jgi:hypothetical protein